MAIYAGNALRRSQKRICAGAGGLKEIHDLRRGLPAENRFSRLTPAAILLAA